MRIKKFENFTESTNVDKAYNLINEQITEFDSKEIIDNTDVDELTKVQTDVLSKYDLPDSDIENIKSKISDAISKKLPSPEIKSRINIER